MKLKLERLYLKPDYTIGKLYIDGKYFCDTLEDQVRDLAKERKIPGRTAILPGSMKCCEYFAQVPPETSRLLDVPGFDGILIHRGNTAEDTSGCILVGENRERGKVINSTRYEVQLTGILERAQEKGKITIEIIQS